HPSAPPAFVMSDRGTCRATRPDAQEKSEAGDASPRRPTGDPRPEFSKQSLDQPAKPRVGRRWSVAEVVLGTRGRLHDFASNPGRSAGLSGRCLTWMTALAPDCRC